MPLLVCDHQRHFFSLCKTGATGDQRYTELAVLTFLHFFQYPFSPRSECSRFRIPSLFNNKFEFLFDLGIKSGEVVKCG